MVQLQIWCETCSCRPTAELKWFDYNNSTPLYFYLICPRRDRLNHGTDNWMYISWFATPSFVKMSYMYLTFTHLKMLCVVELTFVSFYLLFVNTNLSFQITRRSKYPIDLWSKRPPFDNTIGLTKARKKPLATGKETRTCSMIHNTTKFRLDTFHHWAIRSELTIKMSCLPSFIVCVVQLALIWYLGTVSTATFGYLSPTSQLMFFY